MRKLLIALMLLTGLSYAQNNWIASQIDSNATVGASVTIGSDYFLKSVSVDTPWTTANITFQKYDYSQRQWFTVKDKDGSAITLTITSPPANYGLKPVDSWLLNGLIKPVSSSAQGDDRVLTLETGR